MVKDIRRLKSVENDIMLDRLRADLSLNYQHRIPEATKAGIEATLNSLTKYQAHWNEFISALVNRIGLVEARAMIWSNPLAEFKRGMLTYGDTIEEIQVGLLNSHTYDPDRENMEKVLFGTEIPDVQANFHTVNRQEFYKFTVNEALLKRAFLEPGGLSNFVTAMMTAPTTSDNWDEFLLTVSLFAEYEKNGGFYHVNVPDVRNIDSDGSEARLTLRKLRSLIETVQFPSTHYNAAKMPVFAKPEELVIFSTPEFKAAIDVEALAAAFNIDRMDVPSRIITIPSEHFGDGEGSSEKTQAILTTKDFFVIADQKIETTEMPNPASLQSNFFLHHWEVISASRFVPAVKLWTGEDDSSPVTIAPPTDISAMTVTDIDGVTVTGALTRGYIYQLTATAKNDNDIDFGVTYSVTGNNSNRTHITDAGVIHIGPDETASSISIVRSVVGIPSISATTSKTLTGDTSPDWPTDHGHGSDPEPKPEP